MEFVAFVSDFCRHRCNDDNLLYRRRNSLKHHFHALLWALHWLWRATNEIHFIPFHFRRLDLLWETGIFNRHFCSVNHWSDFAQRLLTVLRWFEKRKSPRHLQNGLKPNHSTHRMECYTSAVNTSSVACTQCESTTINEIHCSFAFIPNSYFSVCFPFCHQRLIDSRSRQRCWVEESSQWLNAVVFNVALSVAQAVACESKIPRKRSLAEVCSRKWNPSSES